MRAQAARPAVFAVSSSGAVTPMGLRKPNWLVIVCGLGSASYRWRGDAGSTIWPCWVVNSGESGGGIKPCELGGCLISQSDACVRHGEHPAPRSQQVRWMAVDIRRPQCRSGCIETSARRTSVTRLFITELKLLHSAVHPVSRRPVEGGKNHQLQQRGSYGVGH